MSEENSNNTLTPNASDYVASAAKAALGAVPFMGSLLAEIAGTVIPNQRIDRIVRFATELEHRLIGVEHSVIRSQLTDENFTDLMEEGLRQAARATSDDRRRHIANVIANGLTSKDISYIESKHLLRILGEINDIEVIWLRFYLEPAGRDDEEFQSKHREILAPVLTNMSSPQNEIDKGTLQGSYSNIYSDLGFYEKNIVSTENQTCQSLIKSLETLRSLIMNYHLLVACYFSRLVFYLPQKNNTNNWVSP